MLKTKNFRPLILLVGDFLALALAIVLSIELRNLFRPLGDTGPLYFVLFVVAAIWLIVYYLFGLYDQRQLIFRRQLAQMLTTAQILNAGVTVIFFYFSPISNE